MSRDLDVVRGDLLFKMRKLHDFKGEVIIQHHRSGTVWIAEKGNPANVIVVLRADEWDAFLNLKGVPGGHKDKHPKGPDQTGLDTQTEGNGEEDPRGELRHDER